MKKWTDERHFIIRQLNIPLYQYKLHPDEIRCTNQTGYIRRTRI